MLNEYPDKCIYILRMYGTNYYKIGVASDVSNRVRMLQSGNPILLTCVWHSAFCESRLAHRIERLIHDEYRYFRMNAPYQREWFRLTQEQVKQAQATIGDYLLGTGSDRQGDLLLDVQEGDKLPNNA